MAYKLVGPFVVKRNGVELGRTSGGATVELRTIRLEDDRVDGGHVMEEIVTHGEGTLSMFEWSGDVEIGDELELMDFGELVFESDEVRVVLPRCKLLLGTNLNFGRVEQRPFPLRLYFERDGSGVLMRIEEV